MLKQRLVAARGVPSRPVVLALLAIAALPAMVDAQGQARWYRGNTHAHTLESDGDSPPDSVARWYRDHGYQFLFITDHERITDPEPLNRRWGAPNAFLVIAGQEITQRVADTTHADRRRQAHVNALGARQVILPLGERGIASGVTVAESYARHFRSIAAAGGIAQVNHPNYRWSVRLEDLANLPDSTLLEIANAHTAVNNAGGHDPAGRAFPPAEALWDSLLTRGRLVFAVADDDSHSFRSQDADRSDLTRPGRAWIVVRADTLTEGAVLLALRRGEFYASTGVVLASLHRSADSLALVVEQGPDDASVLTEFIGRGGRVLAAVPGRSAVYRLRGDEGYVRARVTDSNGRRAWIQPVRTRR